MNINMELNEQLSKVKLPIASTNEDGAEPALRREAEEGCVVAMYTLSHRLFYGDGIEPDFEESMKFLRAAAEAGFHPAEFDRGMMYLSGNGVEQNSAEAERWLQ